MRSTNVASLLPLKCNLLVRCIIRSLFATLWFNVLCLAQVNFIKDDGQVIHFNNPKVQASLGANTFAVMGHAETKRMSLMCSM